MIQTVYIDTSVVGGVFDEEFKFWTELFFNQVEEGYFKVVLSTLLEGELMEAPGHVIEFFEKLARTEVIELEFSPQAELLSREYLNETIVGMKSLVDCQHIATATVNNIESTPITTHFSSVHLPAAAKTLEFS